MSEQTYTEFIMVRHCETAWNEQRRLQGQADIPLNETGLKQARALAEQFSTHIFDAIYASSLKRAHQTAEAIALSHNKTVIPVPDLMETNFGSAEGLSYNEYHDQYREALETRRSLPLMDGLKYPVVPDGETYFDVMERVTRALHCIAPSHLGKTVLIVTHGGIIKSLLMHLSEIDSYSLKIPHGAHIALQGDGIQLIITDATLFDQPTHS